MGMFMRVIDWSDFIGEGKISGYPEQTAMTIGVFDGVHRGHRSLMEKIVRQGPNPTAVTFRQSPKQVINPGLAGGTILSLSQKLSIFEGLGIFQTILIDFSENFSRLKGQEFIDLLITRGNLTYLVIGSNFRCGYRLDTDAARIKRCIEARGIKTEVVSPVLDGAYPVSSSRIRQAITEGDLARARSALGRNVAIDLGGMAAEQGEAGLIFNIAAQGRVVPPDGRYAVVVYGINREREKTEIRIKQGKICIPSHFNAVRGIEFLCGSQGE